MMPKQPGILRPIVHQWARLTSPGRRPGKRLASPPDELGTLAEERAHEVARLRQALKDMVRKAELARSSPLAQCSSDEAQRPLVEYHSSGAANDSEPLQKHRD
jgi:hypothetical protein